MAGFEEQFERLELKYLIDEFTADRVRRDIEPYCRPDPHNAWPVGSSGRDRSRRPGYRIDSLYLDSPGLTLFQAKERGDPDRLKLRVRTYRDSPLAVLEIKRKVSDIISKTRAEVDRAHVEGIASGQPPPATSAAEDRFFNDFALTSARTGAEPTLHVRYDREAYSSDVDSYARVTFDRRIEVRRTRAWELDPGPDGWCAFDHYRRPELRHKSIVLELKCQSLVPWWITNLIRSHALKRRSISKYGVGIYLTGLSEGGSSLPRRSARVLV